MHKIKKLKVFNNRLCDSLASWEDTGLCSDLWVRPGAFPRVDHMKCASFWQHLAILANIRPGWKGLSGTNTLAYCEHEKIIAVESFFNVRLS
jgi:hypothetical protein